MIIDYFFPPPITPPLFIPSTRRGVAAAGGCVQAQRKRIEEEDVVEEHEDAFNHRVCDLGNSGHHHRGYRIHGQPKQGQARVFVNCFVKELDECACVDLKEKKSISQDFDMKIKGVMSSACLTQNLFVHLFLSLTHSLSLLSCFLPNI